MQEYPVAQYPELHPPTEYPPPGHEFCGMVMICGAFWHPTHPLLPPPLTMIAGPELDPEEQQYPLLQVPTEHGLELEQLEKVHTSPLAC